MNDQQFFTKSINHLRAQGRKALGQPPHHPKKSCMYRTTTKDGEVLMCAVGGVMTKKLLKKLEQDNTLHWPFVNLVVRDQAVADAFHQVNFSLIREVQDVHDHNPPSRWERGFKRIAKTWNLELPE